MDDSDKGIGSVQCQYDWSTISPSTAVVNALAAIENDEPEDLSVTLYNYIDPEALDALVANDRHITVSFALGEYWIQVDHSGVVITDN